MFSNLNTNDLFIFDELDFSNLREFYNYSDEIKNLLITLKTQDILFFARVVIKFTKIMQL